MIDFSNILCNSLDKYFNILSKTGYKSYNSVNKIIVLLAIDTLLRTELSYYITEDDYKSITNVIYCILGSECMFEMPSYETFDSLLRDNSSPDGLRITEDSINRITEDTLFRIKC